MINSFAEASYQVPLTDLDRKLLNELLAGHGGSWKQFVDRFSGLIMQVIRQTASAHSLRLTGDDAEDLCADTFSELLQSDMAALRSFRGKCSFATYLAVITRRIVVRRLTEHRFMKALGHVKAHQAAVDFASSDAPVSRQVESRDQVDRLLTSLPQDAGQLLRMIYLEGLSYAEAAVRLGLSLNSIGPMLSRARVAAAVAQQD